MSRYVLTPRARADIFNVRSYIADEREAAADRVEQAIYDGCEFVSSAPSRAIRVPTSRIGYSDSGLSLDIRTTQLCIDPMSLRRRSSRFFTGNETYDAC